MSVVSNFQFEEPLLLEANFCLNPEYIPDASKEIQLDINFHRNISMEDGTKEAIVELTVRINKNEDSIKENCPYWMLVKYGAKFIWTEEYPPEIRDNFLEINAPSLLLGYIRPIISQLTAFSPYPVYNLPMINMNEIFKNPPQQ